MTNNVTIWADGSHPHDGRICIVMKYASVTMIHIDVDTYETSNESEWASLHRAIGLCDVYRFDHAIIHMDSQLVVKQFTGSYKVKHPRMKKWYSRTKNLINQTGLKLNLLWVPRTENLAGIELERRSFNNGKHRIEITPNP